MFGVSGSKRVMLANYRRSMSGGVPDEEPSQGSPESRGYRRAISTPFSDDDPFGTPETTRRKRPPQSSVRNHHELERILDEDSVAGQAVRKVAKAASRFVKERDYVLISAFETSALDFANFRILLKRQFFLIFSDEEFVEVCDMFDTNNDQVVDGSEFIVVFTILSNIMKNQLRQKQRERKLKDEEAFRKMEEARLAKKEKYLENAVDYNFTQKDEESALNKINRAAEIYDRTHHSARSISVFEQLQMDPVQFRDGLKGSFDVLLTPQELGAAIMHYNDGREGPIKCQDFIVSFLRYGYQFRMDQHTKQVMETRESEDRARKEHQRKVLRNLESLEDAGVEFDFSENDKESMLEKIRTAAGKYDKNHPGAVSLAGFDAKYLTPGAFRLTLLRTFNVELTNKELGALTKMFDRKDNETICNHDFLVHFTRVGYQVRSEKRAAQLEMERAAQAQEADDHEKKMFAQWKIDNAHFDPDAFTKTDEETALRKLKREASRYHSEHVSAPDLSVFNGADMSVAEFREMLKRQINLVFTYPELASLLPLIGSKTDRCRVSTSEFLNKFKSMGWKERQKRRAVQLKLLAEQNRKLEEDKKLRREKMSRQMNDIVDYDFTQAEMDSAVEKMTQAAYKYDKNHAGSGSLEGFMGRSMEPGVFGRMVNHTFHVKLTGKELGAIISIYDADGDGHIDSAEFLSNFFMMQRECKEVVRKERFEKKKKLEDGEVRRLMEKVSRCAITYSFISWILRCCNNVYRFVGTFETFQGDGKIEIHTRT
jgi:Ca2+-binding EF-hand superfamily protein